jgi:16S rRNA processing protein RimM
MSEPGEPGPPLVAVGEILRPHGVRGEVKVRPLTDRPRERFARLRDCYVWEPEGDRREGCRIASRRFEGEGVVVRLDGVESPEQAARLTGRLLAVARADALPPGAGRFYPWELEGAVVQTREGRRLGSFVRAEGSPAQPLWVVADGDREWLLPAVPEIVLEVSVKTGRIVVDPPEGLAEL